MGIVGVDVDVHYFHCTTIDKHPPTLSKRKVLTFGQIRELSSAGMKVLERFKRQAHIQSAQVIRRDWPRRE